MGQLENHSLGMSPMETHTQRLAGDYQEKGLYYNVNKDYEDFINVFNDTGGDPFHSFSNDPLAVGFKLFFHFDNRHGLLADSSYENSALAYLQRTGQTERYNVLFRLINLLSKVSTYSSWSILDVNGLNEAWETKHNQYLYTKNLDFKCMESLDWRIQAIGSMFREIYYDYDRGVEVLPENLREFNMSLYVYDFRNFSAMFKDNIELLQTIYNQDVRQLNHVMFDFGMCTFNEDSGKDLIENASSNNNLEYVLNNFSIDYKRVARSSLFKSIIGNSSLKSSALQIPSSAIIGVNDLSFAQQIKRLPILQSIQDDLDGLFSGDTWKRQLGNVISGTEQSIIDKVNSELTGLYLGNVHGFSLDDLGSLSQNSDFRDTFNTIYQNIQGNQSLSLSNFNPNATDLGNIND